MARSIPAAVSTVERRELPRRAARAKAESSLTKAKEEAKSPRTTPRTPPRKRVAPKESPKEESETPKKKTKREEERETRKDKRVDLQAKKLKAYATGSPFPDLARPTPDECRRAHRLLASLHGARPRPDQVVAPRGRAGCGDAPSVLDALVRTILSQHTSDANSARAQRGMDEAYGRCGEGGDGHEEDDDDDDDDDDDERWDAVARGGRPRLREALRPGGLADVKSGVVLDLLAQVRARAPNGDDDGGRGQGRRKYSLEHLRGAATADAMRELLGFRGVGPKTASCVLLFCLGRASFAVDTHVHRLAGLLGWRPPGASRDETHRHLDARVPDEDKYGLHVLLVTHGRTCRECRAGGADLGRCELRRAFGAGSRSRWEGEAGEEEEEEEDVRPVKEETPTSD